MFQNSVHRANRMFDQVQSEDRYFLSIGSPDTTHSDDQCLIFRLHRKSRTSVSDMTSEQSEI